MGVITTITLIIALLGGNALFVAAEFALISSRRDRIENLIANGNTRAKPSPRRHITPLYQPRRLPTRHHYLFPHSRQSRRTCHRPLPNNPLRTPRHSPPASASLLRSRLAIITYLHILLGEMVPKTFLSPTRKPLPSGSLPHYCFGHDSLVPSSA